MLHLRWMRCPASSTHCKYRLGRASASVCVSLMLERIARSLKLSQSAESRHDLRKAPICLCTPGIKPGMEFPVSEARPGTR